jgi:hypothetical protein
MMDMKKFLLLVSIFILFVGAVYAEETNQTDQSNGFIALILEKFSVIKGDIMKLSARMYSADANPVSDKKIDFYLNESKIGEDFTDEAGTAIVSYDTSSLEPGSYIVKAQYENSEMKDSADITVDGAEETIGGDSIVEETSFENLTEEVLTQGNTTTENKITENTSVEENEILIPDQEVLKAAESSGDIEKIEDCVNVTWQEEETIYKRCTGEENITICDEISINQSITENQTCHSEVSQYEYSCVDKINTIDKSRKDCKTKAYVINKEVKLDTKGYSCSVSEEKSDKVLLCDSIYDGNGDGICTSGESCLKFIIKGKTFKKLEKNSRDDFIEDDRSFFLQRASAEVLQ